MADKKLTLPSFIQLSEMSVKAPIALLVYGGSGVGKTTFLGSAGSRNLIIDCGLGPIEVLKSKLFRERYPNVDPIIVQVREKFVDGIPQGEAFDLVTDSIDYALANFPDKFDTVSVDTGLRGFAMTRGVHLSGELNKSQTLAKMKSKQSGIIVPAIQDYGMEMGMVDWFCRTYVDVVKQAGKNFVMSAHVRETYAKKGMSDAQAEPTLIAIRPGFTGQTFPDDVTAIFDEVWLFERVSGSAYRCKPYGDDIITAKTTRGAGILASVEKDPDFTKMLARMNGELPSTSSKRS